VSLVQTIRRTGKPSQPDRSLDPAKIEFGRSFTPNFFAMHYENGAWGDPVVEPLHNFSLHPAALVFHYAQAIFEGLKAYRWSDGSVVLFRPEANAKRFNSSARRMNMPEVPEQLFLDGISNLVDMERGFVPEAPGSLYIRPTMIATESCVGVRSSKEFIFYVITLPTGAYFPKAPLGAGNIRVQIAESAARAAHGGTGNVKAAANYAVTLRGIEEAKKNGCDQVLYLDATGERFVEEMGGMNVFFVREGQLLTPPLGDTALPGVTRDSILKLAQHLGIPVAEKPLQIDEVVRDIRSGKITEAMACGTAAVVTGIGSLRFEDGEIVELKQATPGPVASQLYEILQGIQFGREKDPFGWVRRVAPLEE
jgi:branched-chain amino acid aminotransferase